MSTTIFLPTGSSQELCQKIQSTRRRRRHVGPEDPDSTIRQDRANCKGRKLPLWQMLLTALSIELTNRSYLPSRCRRSHLQLSSLTASPSSASSSPTAAFKQTSQNRLRRLTPPQRLYRPWGCIVSLEAQGDGASPEPYSSFSRSL